MHSVAVHGRASTGKGGNHRRLARARTLSHTQSGTSPLSLASDSKCTALLSQGTAAAIPGGLRERALSLTTHTVRQQASQEISASAHTLSHYTQPLSHSARARVLHKQMNGDSQLPCMQIDRVAARHAAPQYRIAVKSKRHENYIATGND